MNRETNQIIRTAHIRTVLDHLSTPSDTLVLFDLDKTLLIPSNLEDFGSLLAKKAIKKVFQGSRSIAAQENAFIELLQEIHIDMKTVEDETTSIVTAIQDRSIPAWCITARFPSLLAYTMQHLTNANIHFSRSRYAEQSVEIQSKYPSLFKNGVIFCGRGNNKGSVILSVLQNIKYCPKRILFVDDHLHNLTTIQDIAIQHDIEFLGIHYDRLKPFDDNKFVAAWPLLLYSDH